MDTGKLKLKQSLRGAVPRSYIPRRHLKQSDNA